MPAGPWSRYDDGGYSGGSTDGPDLQRLLDDSRTTLHKLSRDGDNVWRGAPLLSIHERGWRTPALAASRYWICKLQEYFFAHDIPRAMKARELVWSTRRCFMLWSKPHEVFGIDAR